jgi:hypothetical protein
VFDKCDDLPPKDPSYNSRIDTDPLYNNTITEWVVGSVVTFTCLQNYILNGTNTTKCKDTGTWSVPYRPRCQLAAVSGSNKVAMSLLHASMAATLESEFEMWMERVYSDGLSFFMSNVHSKFSKVPEECRDMAAIFSYLAYRMLKSNI